MQGVTLGDLQMDTLILEYGAESGSMTWMSHIVKRVLRVDEVRIRK